MKISDGITLTPYLRKTPNIHGEFPISIRITDKRKTTLKSIGYSIKERYWNKPKNEIRTNCPDYEKINRLINDKIEEIKKEKELKITPKNNKQSFLNYFNNYIEDLSKLNRIADRKTHIVVKNCLLEFSNNNDILFSDIDNEFLKNLKFYFINKKPNGLQPNTYRHYFKKIRHLYYQAISEEKFTPINNPFLTFKHDKVIVSNKSLTLDEFSYLQNFNIFYLRFSNDIVDTWTGLRNLTKTTKPFLEIPEKETISEYEIKNLFNVKNYFCFQFYARGMRVSDVITLKWNNINNGKIEYFMRKTKSSVKLDIVEQMISLMRFYIPWKYKMMYFDHLKNSKEFNFDVEMYLSLTDLEKEEIKTLFHNRNIITDDLIKNFIRQPFQFKKLNFKYLKNLFNIISQNTEHKVDYIFPFISKEERFNLEKIEKNLRVKKEWNLISSKVALYNKHLKLINKWLKQIKTNVTSHLARHTFASITMMLGSDVNTISKSLAHANLSITQNYIKTLDDNKRVDDKNRRIFKKINIKNKKMVDDNKDIVII